MCLQFQCLMFLHLLDLVLTGCILDIMHTVPWKSSQTIPVGMYKSHQPIRVHYRYDALLEEE